MKNKPICYLLLLVLGCKCRDPVKRDIIGGWNNSSGATIFFDTNGRFFSKTMPTKLLIHTSTSEEILSGNGRWELSLDQGRWVISTTFDSTNTIRFKDGFRTVIEVSGNGILGKNPPFYPFLWKGEDGGEKFKFSKSN